MTKEKNELHDEDLFIQFDILMNGLQSVKLQINTLHQNVKQIEKVVKKKMKGLKKEVTKKTQKGPKIIAESALYVYDNLKGIAASGVPIKALLNIIKVDQANLFFSF